MSDVSNEINFDVQAAGGDDEFDLAENSYPEVSEVPTQQASSRKRRRTNCRQEMQASLRNGKAHGLIFSTPIHLLQVQMLKSLQAGLQSARNLSKTDNCEQFGVFVGLQLKEKQKEKVEKYMKKITEVRFEQL